MMHFSTVANHTTLMFREWRVISLRDASGSFVAVLALAMLYECVKALHVTVRLHLKDCEWENPLSKKIFHLLSRLDVFTQLSKTCLFVVELFFAYFLMLIAMTYNTWFFAALVIGRGLGYYLITPLIGSQAESEEGPLDYYAVKQDSPITRRKRQPLVENADV